MQQINRDRIRHALALDLESVLRVCREVFQVETKDSGNGPTRLHPFTSSIAQSHSATADKTDPGLER